MGKSKPMNIEPDKPTTINCDKPIIFRIETISGSITKGTPFPDNSIEITSKSDIKKSDLIYIDESKLN